MRVDYIVNCGFESVRVRANLVDASAPILIVDNDDEEITSATGYQTADARHREMEMAVLAVRSLGRDWWSDPSDTIDDEDAYIRALIRSVRQA